MKLKANVIGATGMVGSQLVSLLLNDDRFDKVRIFVRRDAGIKHPKLEQQIVDFSKKETWAKKLTGDVLFSALGTTRKKAGGKKRQYEIDFTFNLHFARQARENGINNCVLVSSAGASSDSKLFYARMKGELDDAVIHLGFKNPVILRPSALKGDRKEKRPMEDLFIPVTEFVTRFIFKKYRPIEAETVAQAMVNASLGLNGDKIIWEADEVFELASKK
jgi:uncharacterized protein YbjT (DUF2867 family)